VGCLLLSVVLWLLLIYFSPENDETLSGKTKQIYFRRNFSRNLPKHEISGKNAALQQKRTNW
jgi:hypothetical protein